MSVNTARKIVGDQQLLRYGRQIFLSEIDLEGQTKLLNSRVLVFGMGGLGSPISMYLATSGVGELVIVDPDRVELSNLQRQIVHTSANLGNEKVDSAQQMLGALNPEVQVRTVNRVLEGDDLIRAVREADVVVDGTDNFDARFAITRACVQARTPLVTGAVVRFEGQVSVFPMDRPDSPCYACLYSSIDEPPRNCSENGVLGSVAGIIGCIQATEAIKVLLGIGDTLAGRLLVVDALHMEWHTIGLKKDPHCEVCGVGKQSNTKIE